MNMPTHHLASRQCKPYKKDAPALTLDEVTALLSQLDGWKSTEQLISKAYTFKNHYQTIAFVNAVAWVSHREDHHPDITIGYNKCLINYTTHAINGLSDNDFICAAKIDTLFKI